MARFLIPGTHQVEQPGVVLCRLSGIGILHGRVCLLLGPRGCLGHIW